MSENVKRVNLRFTPQYFDKLDEARFRSRLSFQQLGAQLFDSWLAGDADVPLHSSLHKQADPLLEKLAIIQAHGDKGPLALVQKAIEVSYLVMQQCVTPDELAHLKAVAYGEAEPAPEPQNTARAPKKAP